MTHLEKTLAQGVREDSDLLKALKEYLLAQFVVKPLVLNHQPEVILVIGINGSGKTTSIGKLAHYYRQQGKSVAVASGDTYRAAANEQLAHWASSTGAL